MPWADPQHGTLFRKLYVNPRSLNRGHHHPAPDSRWSPKPGWPCSMGTLCSPYLRSSTRLQLRVLVGLIYSGGQVTHKVPAASVPASLCFSRSCTTGRAKKTSAMRLCCPNTSLTAAVWSELFGGTSPRRRHVIQVRRGNYDLPIGCKIYCSILQVEPSALADHLCNEDL